MSEERTGRHLNILAFFYILFSACGFLGLLIVPLYRRLIEWILEGLDPPEAEMQRLMDTLDLLHYSAIILAIVHLLVNWAAAYAFFKRKWHGLCFVNAVLTCLAFPVGTVLGVFSIVVLSKDEARKMYGLPPKQPPRPRPNARSGEPEPTAKG